MSSPFTLVSWNVFQGLHNHSSRRQLRPNPGIDEAIASLDADVLVLPEAWRYRTVGARWAEQLAADLGYELHQWIADRPSVPKYVVPWRMVIMTRIPARTLPTHVFPEFGPLGRRAIVRVALEESGLTLAGAHLFGIHLLRGAPWHWRTERREFRRVTATHDIIAGDLNMWGPVIQLDANGRRRAVNGRTFPATRPHSQIDHVLISDHVEVLASDVLAEMGSDHRAVRVTLRATQ